MSLFGDIVNIFFPTPPGAPTASQVIDAAVGAITNAITGGGNNNGGGGNVHGATAVDGSPLPPPPPHPPSPPPGHASGPVTTPGPPSPPPGVPFNPDDFPNISGRNGTASDLVNALNLIDSLQKPPPSINQDYVSIINWVCSFLGVPVPPDPETLSRPTGTRPMWQDTNFPEATFNLFGTAIHYPIITGGGIDSEEKMRNAVNKGRNDIYGVVNRVNAFVARAKNAGFVPPENPFSLAMSYNVGRVGFTKVNITIENASKIANNIISYLKLLNAEQSGQLNLDRNVNKAAQLSHSSLSLEGFGGTGNTSVDLAKLLPDADEVKEQKAFEALSVFDFTKRIPKVIFTAFYAPDGTPKGVIVGWKKIPDASGYVIKRKNIFDDREARYSLTNDDVKRDTTRLKEYVKAWILSFYDNIQPDYVFTFLDNDVPPHGYFHYTVQAYQLQNEIQGTLFATETVSKSLSAPQRQAITQQAQTAPVIAGSSQIGSTQFNIQLGLNAQANAINQANAQLVSPYPALAHLLLGDGKYDWLLAAVNVRASINRGDSRTVTRGYSYLAAQYPFLFSQMDAGKFVVPKNIPNLLKGIEEAISKYGVMQVLKDVLQETGALYHFEGKDPNDNTLFRNVDSGAGNDSSLVAIVASAIDPETATMNLKTLATNLPLLLSHEGVSILDQLQGGSTGSGKIGKKKVAKSGEIDIPQEFDKPDPNRAEDEIQYVNKLGNLAEGVVDLMTTDGVATFIRTIRIFSDIGPNRGDPLTSQPQVLTPDPVKPYLPAPPPVSPVQPVQEPFIEASNTSNDRARIAQEAADAKAQAKADMLDAKKAQIQSKVDPSGRGGRGRGGRGGNDV